MELFDYVSNKGHEQVVFFHSKSTGLKAIVAIHDTTLGPALGGLRMWPYETEEAALKDVLRLSRGMTYKAAVSGLNLGGGKAVIIGDPEKDKSEAFFRSFGRFINTLGGRYITAEDVNTTVEDMEYIYQETDNVVGVHPAHGGSGDPSPYTAFGTFRSIEATLNKKYGNTNIGDYSYAVQGVGSVGYHLVKMLRDKGAKVYITDINEKRVDEIVQELGAEAVGLNDIYDTDAKVFVPCALGGVINENTIDRLKCDIVCGSANNQLDTSKMGHELESRNILYAPDYAVNAGGLINVAIELQGYDTDRSYRMVSNIYNIMERIYKISERDSIPPFEAANRLAEERIKMLGETKLVHTRNAITRLTGRRRTIQVEA
ncbi:MAG: Glu/Leu/Phe/Val dehydrogenase [Gammaproteobacteria bacterium]|nr:leucine dehydrogenase [Gammaproteobacteria bacterium]NNC96681.1 Glu/Leu/Phe/Val dehydrogenase [Gammaproteobacteria bacterium]NNM13231.1 Glu/Leu/Phe/Val dehydrogenase [Gammaproteobacteria bacterium]